VENYAGYSSYLKRVKYSRITSFRVMRQLVDLMRRTTKKRLMNQGRYGANCLLSDTSDNDDAKMDVPLDEVDVNDQRPAVVDLMSCNSSFSDCSLPCHELITCSPPTQLAKGRVKVN